MLQSVQISCLPFRITSHDVGIVETDKGGKKCMFVCDNVGHVIALRVCDLCTVTPDITFHPGLAWLLFVLLLGRLYHVLLDLAYYS